MRRRPAQRRAFGKISNVGASSLDRESFEVPETASAAPRAARRIAILLPSLEGGGAERSMLTLTQAFTAEGRQVDLLVFRPKGAYLHGVPSTIPLRTLPPHRALSARLHALWADPLGARSLLRPVLIPLKSDQDINHLASLTHYLQTVQPDLLLSALTYTNITALLARRLARSHTRIVVSERVALSAHLASHERQRAWRWRYLLPLVSHLYPQADGIVAVSNSVAEDLVEHANIPSSRITTLPNPVVDASLVQLARAPLKHPWFAPGQPPVILGAGRLTAQKDFPTLIRAFAVVRARRPVRLVILGEGRLRGSLESLATSLGVAGDIDFAGFVDNPYRYMNNAAVFALTSLYEGLPGVLIQAMACGCPVVSTDCPGGSAQILEHGRYGHLVPAGDIDRLAAALEESLDDPIHPDQLARRAAAFTIDAATAGYLAYLDSIVMRRAQA